MNAHWPPEGMTTEDNESIKVIYIAGYGRSGSTLFERTLAQLDGFVAAGELTHLWQRGLIENQLCGCGLPFADCGFWQQVMKIAFPSGVPVDPEAILTLRGSIGRMRHLPSIAIRALRSITFQKRLERYLDICGRIYWGIQRVSQAKVIIDSSKDPRANYLLNQIPRVEFYTLHLVRDSRASAFSWSRQKVRPEIRTKSVYMPRYRPLQSGWQWLWHNALVELYCRPGNRCYRIRYEDFILHPRRTISSVLEFMNLDVSGLKRGIDRLLPDGRINLREISHTVAGNPMRFRQGESSLQLDDEWRYAMPVADKQLVTWMTAPLLLMYKYKL